MAEPSVTRAECHEQHRELTTWLRRIEDGQSREADKLDRILAGQSANAERIARLEAATATRYGIIGMGLTAAGLVGGALAWVVGLIQHK